MRVSTITADVSGLETSSYSNEAMNDSPGIQECVCPERRRRDELSAHIDIQLLVDNNRRGMTVGCFGLCGITDCLDRPELDWCWDCVDRLVWGYYVSCVVTIVTNTRSLGIDLFTEGRCVYASTLGLVDVHVRVYDVIPVYVWMKENFKGGLNNVMLRNKAPVDSRYHQRAETIGRCGGHAHQWTIDRSVCGGGSVFCTVRFMALIGRTYSRLVAARLGRTSGSGI